MKIPFWYNPNDNIEILEPTKEAFDKYGYACGSSLVKLNQDHIKALQNGKVLAFTDEEYNTFLVLDEEAMKGKNKKTRCPRCDCEYFVWWIELDDCYSSKTYWDCYDKNRHPRSRCYFCNCSFEEMGIEDKA